MVKARDPYVTRNEIVGAKTRARDDENSKEVAALDETWEAPMSVWELSIAFAFFAEGVGTMNSEEEEALRLLDLV